MKEIQLTNATDRMLVDDEDFDSLNAVRWQKQANGYAKRTAWDTVTKTASTVYAHRVVLSGAMVVDHVDGNKLNNQRKNLRFCTRSENAKNSKLVRTSSSGYKGVNFHKSHGAWRATIVYRGKSKHLGYFDTPEDAHEFYCLAADMVHGEFANHGA